MRGIGVAVALIAASVSLSGCERYKLDEQMEELCKKDGGIKIYEAVTLPINMLDSSGNVSSRFVKVDGKNVLVLAENYIETEKIDVLKQGDPLKGEGKLARIYTSITRIEDGKVLVEAVQYRRAGGDRFYIGHFTQASCPSGPLDLSRKALIMDNQD